MRFTISRAKPSRRKASSISKSSATVSVPSLATVQPGISSLTISTDSLSIVAGPSAKVSVKLPSCSKRAISACDKAPTASATAFIRLPNCLPITRKLHFTVFSSKSPSTKTNSFTLTSSKISCCTASIAAR